MIQRWRRSGATSGKLIVVRFKLVAAFMASCYGSIGELSSTGPTVVAAFRASPPRMTSNAPNGNTRIRSQQVRVCVYVCLFVPFILGTFKIHNADC